MATARRKLASALTRAINSDTLPNSHPIRSYSRSLFSFSSLLNDGAIRYRPLSPPARFKPSWSQPLNEPSNWTNRPPKETILLDGCDFEHWLVIMEFSKEPKPTEDEMINSYVKTLAAVLGSEEEAKKKIYSVNTRTYTGFGCLIPEDLSHKVKECPGVLWVLPDSYLDIPNKDYGGDLFEDGKVTHRPRYWYENSPQNTPRRRPRHDRHRERMQMERGRGEWMQPPQGRGGF